MHTSLISELETLQPVPLDAGLIFSGKASGKRIQGHAQPTAYTPVIDPNYLFHESSRDIIVWLMNPADSLYVFSSTGCGKTSCIKQLAPRLNYFVFKVTGHGRLEPADLTGHLAMKNGSMVYEYGPLALVMRYGGIVLLNEIDLTFARSGSGAEYGARRFTAVHCEELIACSASHVPKPTPMAAAMTRDCTRAPRGRISHGWIISCCAKSAIYLLMWKRLFFSCNVVTVN